MAGEHGIATFGLDWNRAPIKDLTAYIVAVHHRRFRVELSSLRGLVKEVYASHRQRDFARLAPLPNLLFLLADEMERHMRREELTIFPAIEACEKSLESVQESRLANRSIADLISAALSEHDDILDRLAEVRQVNGGYDIPPYANRRYRTLLQQFEAVEHDLKFHIALENDSIFSRALSFVRGAAEGERT